MSTMDARKDAPPSLTDLVATRLRGVLAEQRRSQGDMALFLGLSQAAVSRRLAGKIPIDLNEVDALAHWLDVPLARLIPLQPERGGQVNSGWKRHLTLVPTPERRVSRSAHTAPYERRAA